MLPFEDRFTRQRQLREVGLAGQVRLEASAIVVGYGVADSVAADYLERAGVQVTRDASLELVSGACAESRVAATACTFLGPANYLAGALTALNHVRSVLGLDYNGSASKDLLSESGRDAPNEAKQS